MSPHGSWGGHSTWASVLVEGNGGALLTFNWAGGLLSAFVNGCCWICMVVVGAVGARRWWCWTYEDGSQHLSMGARGRT